MRGGYKLCDPGRPSSVVITYGYFSIWRLVLLELLVFLQLHLRQGGEEEGPGVQQPPPGQRTETLPGTGGPEEVLRRALRR